MEIPAADAFVCFYPTSPMSLHSNRLPSIVSIRNGREGPCSKRGHRIATVTQRGRMPSEPEVCAQDRFRCMRESAGRRIEPADIGSFIEVPAILETKAEVRQESPVES